MDLWESCGDSPLILIMESTLNGEKVEIRAEVKVLEWANCYESDIRRERECALRTIPGFRIICFVVPPSPQSAGVFIYILVP